VREIKTRRIVLITHGKYETPNDAKALLWSPDSKKFAAFYHYGQRAKKSSQYTWIGIWSLETGKLLRTKEEAGWVLVPKNVP